MIIDTHIHFDLKQFNKDLDQVIENARVAGIKKFIIPSVESNKTKKIIEIVEKYEDIYFAAGNHPNRLDSFDLEAIRSYLEHPKCVAVGECGLDWYRIPKNSNLNDIKDQQKEMFCKQIELSIEFNKPLILHSRDTDQDMFDTLMKYKGQLVGGVIHCFVGSEKLLELSKEGFYFGLGGVLTYKNNEIDKVLSKLDLDKILLETDGPYLTPVPFRGKRNEPKYIPFILKNLSDKLNIKVEDLEKIIEKNTSNLFKI